MAANNVPAVERLGSDTPARPVELVEGGFAADVRFRAPADTKPPAPPAEPVKFPDVGLRFLIDPKSKEVTVLMVDRSTQRVVRTIPPGELTKFKEGDLVDLFY